MKRMSGKWMGRILRAFMVAGFALGFAGNATAGPVRIDSMPTPLQGNSEVMISLRHQDHMWEAANGETYLVINRGLQASQGSLQLYSSPDRGLSWFPGPRLPGSDRNAFSDGYLDGNILYLTYTNTTGQVVFTALQRKPTATPAWKTLWSETAFSSPDYDALNPAMAVDATGTIWLAFVAQDLATGDYSIKMVRNTSREGGWVDTGLTFGDIGSGEVSRRSARPVATATGMGMIYSVHDDFFWAMRENGSDPDAPWTSQLLFTSHAGDSDPYASHFSVVADAQNYIHMSFSDGQRVGYIRIDATTGQWASKWLSGIHGTVFLQTSVVASDIIVAANVYDNIWIYRSVDGGTSFTAPFKLVHPAPGSGVSYQTPRVETASHSTGPLLVFQQYVDNNVQRLLLFNVPLP